MDKPHVSVLANEWLGYLAEKKIRIYVDGTLGAGGHAETVLHAHPEIDLLVGIDQDSDALEIARKSLSPWADKIAFVQNNFSHQSNSKGRLRFQILALWSASCGT